MPQQTDPSAETQALLEPWTGPYGGLPPMDRVTPAALEEAVGFAIAAKRAEVRAIATALDAPTFANTLEALEDSGRALARVRCLATVFSNSLSLGDMPAVAQRIAPRLAALDDEMAHDEALFARIETVWRARATSGLSAEQQRLVQEVRKRMQRRGAGLGAVAKARLAEINMRLAALSSHYNQNLIEEAAEQVVFIDDEAGLDGLPEALRQAAAATAAERGRPGAWAIANARGAVWPFLIHATRRDLRERVWRMWTNRGDNPGKHDNKPIAAEMLLLRGELAKLLGHASYAHFALADRMARTPEAALSLLDRTWSRIKPVAEQQIADYQALADREGLHDALRPWDRQFYAERLRRERLGLDAEAIKAHLPLAQVMQAMFWAAGRVHGLSLRRIEGVPVIHPTVQVYEVTRGDEAVAVIYFDLLNRPGKMHGSYQYVYRDAENFRGRVLPVVSVNSSFPPPPEGQPILLPWEYANVFFHEFGHALHMIHAGWRYASLSSQHVAWDFVELPALINERWLRSREVLHRFARHHITGEPMPDALIDKLEEGLKHDRVFSVNPDFLLPAIIDMRLHLLADGSGRAIDPIGIENATLTELGMPPAWDLIMRGTHNAHLYIGGSYAAGLYVYLWADVMAADAAEAFIESPGGLFDAEAAARWRGTLLSVGHTVPAEDAYRHFRGRDPDPMALLRRFGLATAGS